MSQTASYGWQEQFSDEQTELIKSVVVPMLGMWGNGVDLDVVAKELNSRLSLGAEPDEIWTAQRVDGFLTSARRGVKRRIPKLEQVIIYYGRGREISPS
jgi:hypothetical protein